MKVGIPREVKNHEYRVAITPSGVHELVRNGHEVYVETDAGVGSSITNEDYVKAGATILPTADDVWGTGDLILKVKEPVASEYHRMREGQTLFTYLHLAADKALTEELVARKVTGIAYETVELADRSLPLLAPMSEVAGRMAVQAGAYYLEKAHGGKGILLGGVPGVEPAKVVVLGGGVVGTHAITVALGMEADVWVIDRNVEALRRLWAQFGPALNTVFSTRDAIERHVEIADLVIGGVLIPGASAPKLVTHDMIRKMGAGSVVVDVAIDQGGCFETSKPTTHAEPVYTVDGVTHYCVANMPGGVPRTSTYALNNATLPFVLALADKGWKKALADDVHLRNGLNVALGKVTCRPVADVQGYPYVEATQVIA